MTGKLFSDHFEDAAKQRNKSKLVRDFLLKGTNKAAQYVGKAR